jgi:hypothetical protein
MKFFEKTERYEVNLLNFAFRHPVRSGTVSADVFQRIQITRLAGSIKTSFVAMFAGIVVVVITFAEFWTRRSSLWMDFAAVGTIASYIALLHFCRSWTRGRRGHPDAPLRLVPLLLLRFVLASFWGLLLTSFAAVSDPMEHGLVFTILAGVLSTFMFGGPASYALAGWGPVAIGGLASLFATGQLISLAFLICLIIYTMMTFLGMVLLDIQAVENGLTMLRLEHHAETIGILLRDFEESASDWLWETDATLTMRHVSPRFAEVALNEAADMEIDLIRLLTGGAADRPPVP